MAKDAREWLSAIARRYPEEFWTSEQEVRPGDYEASAILECLERESRYPAVLFEKVHNLKGGLSNFRLLMNAFSTNTKIGVALGLEKPSRLEIMEKYWRGQSSAKEPIRIRRNEAPVKQLIVTGGNLDLRELPIPRINEMDGGPYLTPAIVAKRPGSEKYNISWNRCMMIDQNHLGLWMAPFHLWDHFMSTEEQGKSLPIALVLGHHPAFLMFGAGLTKIEQDEYRIVGGVLGEGIRLVQSETWGDQLLIPADAEIVLEGEIVAGKRTIEGPFGEYTFYTGPQRLSWLIEVKALNAKRDGILMNVFGGHQDNLYAHYPIQADIYGNLKAVMPNIVDISWVDSGGPIGVIISMKKKTEGEPMRAGMLALSLSSLLKHAIVVDDDVDPGNLKEVMWALSTRVQADKDINILKGIQGIALDPSIEHETRCAGLIIDATKPSDGMYSLRAKPPEKIVSAIDLKKYFPSI